jgi:tRNA pseudouridine38-40 synthase
MVRGIMGTLVDAGLGKMSAADMRDILQARDRSQAGITAPAHGLFLKEVRYD